MDTWWEYDLMIMRRVLLDNRGSSLDASKEYVRLRHASTRDDAVARDETLVYPYGDEGHAFSEAEIVPKKPDVREAFQIEPALKGEKICNFESDMAEKVIGQPEAISALSRVYQASLVGFNPPNRPVGTLLFAGGTGTGKTHLVRTAANVLLGDSKAMIKIDCAELQHSHEIAKLVGSPPGYIGHRETSPSLNQEALDKYASEKCDISFVLFDEIEKSSDALWNLLLGILDTATLTLGDNRKVDFSKSIIVMTSNLGAQEMNRVLSGKGIGFTHQKAGTGSLNSIADHAIRGKFTPEFINRIDEIVVFHALSKNDLLKIFKLEMRCVQEQILQSKNCPLFVLTWTPEAADYIIDKGSDPRYGARELKRTIEKLVVMPLANAVLSGQIQASDTVTVDFDGKDIVFLDEPRN